MMKAIAMVLFLNLATPLFAEDAPAPLPAPKPGGGVVIKEVPLSECYVLPTFEVAKDVFTTGDMYKTFYVDYGYRVRKQVLLVVVDRTGHNVFTQNISKEELKFFKVHADSLNSDQSRADAQKYVVDAFDHFYNSRRNLQCAAQ